MAIRGTVNSAAGCYTAAVYETAPTGVERQMLPLYLH